MIDTAAMHAYATAPGPWHEGPDALPEAPPAEGPVKFIAYYLPQFHRSPVNDHVWGPGFTEWTNVTKALPRYAGHIQPRLPADLGFYDLTQKAVLEAQAALARRAGIHGFCIHDYWFSGEKVLETPLRVLLANPDIDLRFCLNWANENWSKRWDGSEDEIILAQEHRPGDPEAYIDSIAPALRDPRYIRIGGAALLMIYRPGQVPDAEDMVARWRARARETGLGEIFVVMAQTFDDDDPRVYGMDAAAGFPPHHATRGIPIHPVRQLPLLNRHFLGKVSDYDEVVRRALANRPTDWTLLPGVFPSWDNEARRVNRSWSFAGATPAKYGAWLRAAGRQVEAAAPPEARVVFLNAWNEWAEGAVLEPDRHYGHAWLAETRRAHDDLAAGRAGPDLGPETPLPEDDRTPDRYRLGLGAANVLRNRARGLAGRLGLLES